MTLPECARCGHPVADMAYVCSPCTVGLTTALLGNDHRLGAIALLDELPVTIARLDRLGEAGHSSGETPLPFDWDASDAAWAVQNTITTWARHCAEERGLAVTAEPALWLAGQLEWLRHRPEA